MKSLDICIPAYNEAAVIERTIEAIATVCAVRPDIHCRIIVADNGSTDGTSLRVREQGIGEALIVPGRGKGYAVRYAAQTSTADLFAYLDADLSVAPEHIFEFIDRMDEEGVDIIAGSRLLKADEVERGFLRTLSSVLFQMYMQWVIPVSVMDTQCPLKVVNMRGKACLVTSSENTWFFDIEFLARAYRRGLAISERPITWYESRYPERKSKLSIVSGALGALVAAWRIRWGLWRRP